MQDKGDFVRAAPGRRGGEGHDKHTRHSSITLVSKRAVYLPTIFLTYVDLLTYADLVTYFQCF